MALPGNCFSLVGRGASVGEGHLSVFMVPKKHPIRCAQPAMMPCGMLVTVQLSFYQSTSVLAYAGPPGVWQVLGVRNSGHLWNGFRTRTDTDLWPTGGC